MSSPGADGSQIPIPWLKRLRQSGEFSDVIVRVALEEFKLHLLPLLSDSTYFKKQVDADPDPAPNQGPKLVVDLPDFPGGPEIFHVVVDHWYGSREHEISILNVAKVISASGFLGVESLKNRAFKFVEENVFNCWNSCLAMLATFDCKEDPPIKDQLLARCVDAFLDRIKTKNPLNLPEVPDCSEFCNVTHLLTVVELLPVSMARLLCDRILAGAPGLFYEVDDGTKSSSILLCYTGQSVELKKQVKEDLGEGCISWVVKLPELLPDLAKRATLLASLCKLMMEFKKELRFSVSFLCLLLVQMVETSEAMASRDIPRVDLDSIIEDTVWLVALNMGQVLTNVLKKCKFATIVTMVQNVKSWLEEANGDDGQQIHIDRIAKGLDACLLAHLNQSSLSVAQVLFIYQQYPNSARSSHAGLYYVFKDKLRSKTLSFEQRQGLRQMLDFKKLPESWVKRIFEELELDHEPRLLKRVLEIHQEHAKRIKLSELSGMKSAHDRACDSFLKESLVLMKHFNAFMTAEAELKETKDEDHSVKLSFKLQLQQQAVELTALGDDKLKLEGELRTIRDEKLRLEGVVEDLTAKVAAVMEEKLKATSEAAELIVVNDENSQLKRELDVLRRELEQEKDERLCQICSERPKDAQCLPCNHFLYCSTCLNLHIKQRRRCPMCRTPTTGVNRIT